MIAQFYTDHDILVRIFPPNNPDAIMDLPLNTSLFGYPIVSLRNADNSLRRCHLVRKSKWEKTDWGYEARVYFRQG